ncbi:hypothetical protein GCM10029964_083920 [Kibdelosporangium lantanae]
MRVPRALTTAVLLVGLVATPVVTAGPKPYGWYYYITPPF